MARQVYRRFALVFIGGVLLFNTYSRGLRANGLPEAIQWIQQGDWKRAEAVLDQISSDDPALLYWKSFVLFSTGRYRESAALAHQFLDRRPESAPGRKVLGLCLYMLGNPDSAGRELDQAVKLNPSDSEALYYLGRIYFTRQDLPNALATFEKLMLLDKTSVRGFNHLGQTYEALSRFEEARSSYQKAIDLEKAQTKRSEWPYFNLGVLNLKEGRQQEAIGLLREALVRNTDWPEARIQLAVALSSTGQYEEAKALLEGVLQTDPKNADAHYQMGRLLLKQGRKEQARLHLQQFESLKKKP